MGKTKHHGSGGVRKVAEDVAPPLAVFWVYLSYAIMIIAGHLNEYICKLGLRKPFFRTEEGFAPILDSSEYFYTRRMYGRVRDCWSRPITSMPGGRIDVMECKVQSKQPSPGSDCTPREPDGHFDIPLCYTGKTIPSLNLGSYNYLGFAQNEGACADADLSALGEYGTSACSEASGVGRTALHREMERVVARYLGREDACCFAMGYATNSTTLPALVGKGGLVLSDALNHASIVTGCRGSGAKIVPFKHNDPEDLERLIRDAICRGQSRTHRPYTKILIVVEGVYSMEGELCRLPEIVAIKKKYGCYLYLDEAHSIGAMGSTGRGVCEYWGVDPRDVDVLMGTFTKSFGSTGGYIAGDASTIAYIRQNSFSSLYASTLSPSCVQQIITSLNIIAGEDGTKEGDRRIRTLHDNSNYFRTELKKRNFLVLGDEDSPVVPVMMYHAAKMAAFSRHCLRNGIAVVVVGFPATTLLGSRVRFCLSASHTRADLDRVLAVMDEVGDTLFLKYGDML